MANIELDGANKKIKVDSGDLTLDVPGDIILDADGADLVFADGGTNILKITNSSSDVVFQPQVDAKDIIFKQYDGTTVATIEDNGTLNVPTGKLAINATAITSTAAELNILDGVTATATELNLIDGVTATTAELNILDGVTATASELNLLDGGTSVGGSITLADGDGVVVNDGGTMKTIPASDVKTYAGGAALDDISTGDAASTLATSAGNITIDAQGNDTDIIFKGTDGGADTDFLTLDGSEAGKATFNGVIDVNNSATGVGDAKLTLIASGNFPSNSDTLSLSGAFGSTSSVADGVGDSSYILYLQDLYGASASKVQIQLELNESFGTGNDYQFVTVGQNTGGSNTANGTSQDRISIQAANAYASSWASMSAYIVFPKPRESAARKTLYGQISYYDNNGNMTTEQFTGDHSDGSNKCTGFRLVRSAGNHTGGSYRLYGFRS
jgi:hypothetical protein